MRKPSYWSLVSDRRAIDKNGKLLLYIAGEIEMIFIYDKWRRNTDEAVNLYALQFHFEIVNLLRSKYSFNFL